VVAGVGSVFMGFIAGAFGGESAGVAGFGLSILVGIVFPSFWDVSCFMICLRYHHRSMTSTKKWKIRSLIKS